MSQSSLTSSATSSPTSSPPQEESSTPVGAIAGGVVGGVAGLAVITLIAWLLMRRKRKSDAHNPYLPAGKSEIDGSHGAMTSHQLDDTQITHEVEAGKVSYAHMSEMSAQTTPAELPT